MKYCGYSKYSDFPHTITFESNILSIPGLTEWMTSQFGEPRLTMLPWILNNDQFRWEKFVFTLGFKYETGRDWCYLVWG